MAKTQRYGIRYPFTAENLENVYMDTNKSYSDSIKSQIVHVIFTPKGQKLRDPDFGTSLIDYIFGQKDDATFSLLKGEITTQINKYVPVAKFKDINIYTDENSENGVIVSLSYSIKVGNKTEDTTVAIKL